MTDWRSVPVIDAVRQHGVPQCCGTDMWAWQPLPGATIWRCSHRIHHPLVLDIEDKRWHEDKQTQELANEDRRYG